MPLADIIAAVRHGVIQIEFFNQRNERLGGGTGFLCRRRLLTNHHVFLGHQLAHSVKLRRENLLPLVLSAADFATALQSGSMENSYDYAILNVPGLIDGTEHQFIMDPPRDRRIGDEIAVLGFPFEHQNLTVHRGVISSFYTSNTARIIQLDASVNAGNSGGPLIDPESGVVFGIVSRKATGLTKLFDSLRQSIRQNVQFAQQRQGMMNMGGFDPVESFVLGQNQILLTLDEIERQANVGIGYAISSEHLLADAAFLDDIHDVRHP
jgi:hypothetical protein